MKRATQPRKSTPHTSPVQLQKMCPPDTTGRMHWTNGSPPEGNGKPLGYPAKNPAMKKQKKTSTVNSVNGAYCSSSCGGAALGNASSGSRGLQDRYPATEISQIHLFNKEQVKTAKVIRSCSNRIGTWNVRTLYQAGKLDNVLLEMDRLSIQCLGLCEVRWPQSGDFVKDKKRIFYSGGTTHQHGVGLVLDSKFSKSVLSFWPKSERMLLVKLKASPFNINIIVVYAPTSDAADDEIDSFYESLDQIVKSCKSQEMKIIVGDWNAKIGQGREDKTVGPFGLGERNERGDRLIDWCMANRMVVTNTWFKVHPRRRYTWTQAGDRARNQIDFILIDQRFRNAVKSSYAYPGADVNSDHNPVIARMQLSLKQTPRPIRRKRLMLKSLVDNPTVKDKFKGEVISNMANTEDEDIETCWKNITTAIQKSADNNIPKEQGKPASMQWMTMEIKDLMNQRRLVKQNEVQYNLVNKEIRKQCKEAKDKWLEEKCQEIEQHSLNPKEMYKKVKEIAGKRSSPASKCIRAADGSILHEHCDVANRWVEYVKDLFHDEEEQEMIDLPAQTGPSILKEEVQWALKQMKAGKAPGPDEICVEMLLALEEEGISMLWQICSRVYETGVFPKQMLLSIFITLPKIPGTLECSSHRTISLMSQILKILLKIIFRRIRRQLLPEISVNQYGFMKDCGTRNAIFLIRMLSERAIEHQQDLYMVFIDYTKAFDRVKHKELFKMLKNIQIDEKDLRLLYNLYQQQTATVRLPGGMTSEFEIRRGVRQGCVGSPDLFNLYSEIILRSLEDVDEGFVVNGVLLNNIRYADDTVLLATSQEGLQRLFNTLAEESKRYGLSINAKKTKCMVVSKLTPSPICTLYQDKTKIEQVTSFNYLGSLVTSDGRSRDEIRRRITIAKSSFGTMRSVLTDRKLSLPIKTRLLKCYVWSTLLYGCESWTITAETRRNIEAAEMWFFRRMLRISYMERITNEEVLNRVHQKRQLYRTILDRQAKFLGHSIRKGKLENLVLQGRIQGRRARGRQRRTLMNNFPKLPAGRIWTLARERKLAHSWLASRPEDGHGT